MAPLRLVAVAVAVAADVLWLLALIHSLSTSPAFSPHQIGAAQQQHAEQCRRASAGVACRNRRVSGPWERRHDVTPAAANRDAIDRVMDSDQGAQILRRAAALGEAVPGAVAEGGSSRRDLDELVAYSRCSSPSVLAARQHPHPTTPLRSSTRTATLETATRREDAMVKGAASGTSSGRASAAATSTEKARQVATVVVGCHLAAGSAAAGGDGGGGGRSLAGGVHPLAVPMAFVPMASVLWPCPQPFGVHALAVPMAFVQRRWSCCVAPRRCRCAVLLLVMFAVPAMLALQLPCAVLAEDAHQLFGKMPQRV